MGDLILGENPIMAITRASSAEEATDAEIEIMYRNLPSGTRRILDEELDLPVDFHDNLPERPQRFRNYSWHYLDALNQHCHGVFKAMSFINHSCLPNAQCTFDDRSNQMLLRALTDIPANTEITVSYHAWSRWPSCSQRMTDLITSHGFHCRCAICSEANNTPASRDSRRRNLETLQQHLSTPASKNVASRLQMAEEYCQLVETELGGLESQDVVVPRCVDERLVSG